MTWQINGYFLPLYDDGGPSDLIMTSVLTEHLGVVVEFLGEDEWSVRSCAPWNVSCIHGLPKEEAFEAAEQVADEWRRLIRIMLERGRQGSLIYTPSDVMEEEVGNRGRSACNKIKDRILGTPFWPDVTDEVDGSGYSHGGASTGFFNNVIPINQSVHVTLLTRGVTP